MQYGYANNKPQLQNRLKRIEGQVRGIQNMVETDTYCIDILTQMSAVQAALDKVALELLRTHTKHCMIDSSSPETNDSKVNELVTAVGRMLAR